jgi:hypothetical protein
VIFCELGAPASGRKKRAPDPRRVERLTADLDRDHFTVREKATPELDKLVAWAELVLSHTKGVPMPARLPITLGSDCGRAPRPLEGPRSPGPQPRKRPANTILDQARSTGYFLMVRSLGIGDWSILEGRAPRPGIMAGGSAIHRRDEFLE